MSFYQPMKSCHPVFYVWDSVLKSSSGKFWPPAVVHFIHDLLTCFKSSLQDEERKKSSSAWFITVIITIELLTGFKSSLQDELQEFFSEFGPVHQLNILRDKTSGVSRYSITRKFKSLGNSIGFDHCFFESLSFSGGAALSPTSAVEMLWRHKTDFTM